MIESRYQELMRNDDLELTPEELAEGWHFCAEWDCLLVGPGMGELEPCKCLDPNHPVYKTVPPRTGNEMPIIIDNLADIGTIPL